MPPRRKATKAPPISWPTLEKEARTRFHIRHFRSAQRDVLASVLAGQCTVAIMPTGAGKSLTYQLPAVFLPHPVLVVSPLIALMQDQQDKAQHASIAVDKIDSTLTTTESRQAAEDIAQGSAQLLYVTPERLENPDFLASLKHAGGVSLFVVDEAHTIAQWGHDFRPAYLNLGYARAALGNPPVLALTATATPEIVAEIQSVLDIPTASVFNAGSERENLHLAVHPTVSADAKLARLGTLLAEEQGTGIIYSASVRSANQLYDWLTAHDIAAGRYHGQMKICDREAAQQAFMRGDHKVMIATKAFGLGIDKPDIRFIYHYEFPDSLETYAQEAGRAGRDGQPARAVLLYRLEDKRIQTFFLAGRYPRLADLSAVHTALTDTPAPAKILAETAAVPLRRTQVVLNLLRHAGLIQRTRTGYRLAPACEPLTDEALQSLLSTYIDRAQQDKDRLAAMMHYAESLTCRTQLLRTHFHEPAGDPCNRCDNCTRQTFASTEAPAAQAQPAAAHGPVTHAPVTQVETLTGTIHTTAPETLPTPAPPEPFAPGDRVQHPQFGLGEVLESQQSNVMVRFEQAGKKCLRANFLTPAA